MQYDRRTVLRGAVLGALGTSAGCLDSATDGASQGGTPGTDATGSGTETTASGNAETGTSGEPATTKETTTGGTSSTSEATAAESTAAPACEDGLRRLRIDFPENYELAYRYGFGFELTADPDTLSVGDDVTVELRNTSDEPQTTGPKVKYAIERRVEDGWRHVLQVPEDYTPPRGQVTHQPGEGFTWRLSVNREGLSVGPYTVCAPLQSGEYHFTYWGFPDAKRGLTIGFEIG